MQITAIPQGGIKLWQRPYFKIAHPKLKWGLNESKMSKCLEHVFHFHTLLADYNTLTSSTLICIHLVSVSDEVDYSAQQSREITAHLSA